MAMIKSLELVSVADPDNPNVHDLKLVSGVLHWFEGPEAIGQKIKTSLLFVKGEWYQDQNEGFPYFEQVLIKNPSMIGIKELFRKTIASIPGVARIDFLELAIDREIRKLTCEFGVTTDDGATITEAPFIVE